MDSRVVTTHVPRPLARRLDGFAEKLGRSRSRIVVEALTEWVARQDRSLGGPPEDDKNPAERAAESLKFLRQHSFLDDITLADLCDPGRS